MLSKRTHQYSTDSQVDIKHQPIKLFFLSHLLRSLTVEEKPFKSLNRHLWLGVLCSVLLLKVRQVFQYECTLREALPWRMFERKVEVFLEERSEADERERCTSLEKQAQGPESLSFSGSCQSQSTKGKTPNPYSEASYLVTPGRKPPWSWLSCWPLSMTMCPSRAHWTSAGTESNLDDEHSSEPHSLSDFKEWRLTNMSVSHFI